KSIGLWIVVFRNVPLLMKVTLVEPLGLKGASFCTSRRPLFTIGVPPRSRRLAVLETTTVPAFWSVPEMELVPGERTLARAFAGMMRVPERRPVDQFIVPLAVRTPLISPPFQEASPLSAKVPGTVPPETVTDPKRVALPAKVPLARTKGAPRVAVPF